jgi:Alpha-L-arabinofuranosidase B, catalytic
MKIVNFIVLYISTFLIAVSAWGQTIVPNNIVPMVPNSVNSPSIVGPNFGNPGNAMIVPNNQGGSASFTGPGDIVASATAFWGLRAYNAAYATSNGKLVNVVRASDSHTCDLLAASTGGVGLTANCSSGADNGQSATAFCNSTTCSVTEAYDQTGSGNNVTQSTGADQPTITFNCINTSLPCMTFSGSSQFLQGSGITVNQPFTVSYVAERTGNFNNGGSTFGSHNGVVSLGFQNNANQVYMFAGAATIVGTAADSAAHIVQNVFNGASSIFNIDGTGTTVSPGTSGPSNANPLAVGSAGNGSNFLTGYLMEQGLWPVAFSSAQNTSMCHNQYGYWATSTSC